MMDSRNDKWRNHICRLYVVLICVCYRGTLGAEVEYMDGYDSVLLQDYSEAIAIALEESLEGILLTSS